MCVMWCCYTEVRYTKIEQDCQTKVIWELATSLGKVTFHTESLTWHLPGGDSSLAIMQVLKNE